MPRLVLTLTLMLLVQPVGAGWDAKVAEAAAIVQALDATYPAAITSVEVTRDTIEIRGRIPAPATLAELLPHQPFGHPGAPVEITLDRQADGTFHASLPRHHGGRDRIRSRWVIHRDGKPASPESWPTGLAAGGARPLPKLTAASRKGLGGLDHRKGLEDLVDLGVQHATVNIHLTGLLHPAPRPGTVPHVFEGTTYHLNRKALERHDGMIGFLTSHDIMVSAIILVTPPRNGERHLLTHPESSEEATLAMPNLATAGGAKAYCAVLDLLAERYSRPGAPHGRITNWIAQNEVDQAWTWTNMGEQPMPRLLECYHRSLRLIHSTARKYDPHARAFPSFTHHWAHASDGKRTYRTREMLKLLTRFSTAGGDFEWGLAYHPYPQGLFNPRTWEDKQPTGSFETPKITMKNIEVLDAFLRQPQFRFEGRQRAILLSEQGFHTPDYSEASQRDQAAALVYAWRKVNSIPAIEAFHYHRWLDHPHEGGLKLGLRTLPTPGNPRGWKKRGWNVYKALGTPREAEATAFTAGILPEEAGSAP